MKIKIIHKNGFKVIDLNRRKAIHERCLNCSAWSAKNVSGCTFKDCPLYAYRTGREKQNPKQRQQAVKSYCLWCMNGQAGEVSRCVSKTCPLFYFRGKGKGQNKKEALDSKFACGDAIFKNETRQGISLDG